MIVHDVFKTRHRFDAGHRRAGDFYSLRRLEQQSGERISRLSVSLRIILESILRNHDGVRITEEHIRTLAKWEANADRVAEIPFVVAQVLLQDFTCVPLLVDLAAMRSAAARFGKSAHVIEPLVPVDLVIDHMPCQFPEGTSARSLGLDGSEIFEINGLEGEIAPQQAATLIIKRNGRESTVPLTVRIDTPIEAEYFRHRGILLYVLRQLIGHQSITLN